MNPRRSYGGTPFKIDSSLNLWTITIDQAYNNGDGYTIFRSS